jgi:hypothetical protein
MRAMWIEIEQKLVAIQTNHHKISIHGVSAESKNFPMLRIPMLTICELLTDLDCFVKM